MEGKKLGLFHKFIWFVWMPFSFLASVLRAYEVLSSNIAKYSSYLSGPKGPVVVLILILLALFELCFVAAPVLVFIGFFRLKKYAWYILVIESISNIIFAPIMILTKNTYDVPTVIGKLLGVALDIAIVIYYWRRRGLFGIGSKSKLNSGVSDTEVSYMFCSECGCRVPSGSKYCENCGAKL